MSTMVDPFKNLTFSKCASTELRIFLLWRHETSYKLKYFILLPQVRHLRRARVNKFIIEIICPKDAKSWKHWICKRMFITKKDQTNNRFVKSFQRTRIYVWICNLPHETIPHNNNSMEIIFPKIAKLKIESLLPKKH